MKKQIYTSLFALSAIALIACNTTSSGWSLEQRKSMRRAIHEYRDMVYIDELTDAEFFIFSDNVTDEIEASYPNYNEVIAFPALSDTIDSFVTTIIIEQLDADASNMSHIYPYRELRKEGILPEALTRQQQRMFYKCFARKVDQSYSSFGSFFEAVVYNTMDKGEITLMQESCAKSLFDWSPKSSK